MRVRSAVLTFALAAGAVPALTAGGPATAADAADPSIVGRFDRPFEEPGPKCDEDETKRSICKPAAASVVSLPNGKILYWDALEGMEDVGNGGVVAEYGGVAQNDATRVLDISGRSPQWSGTSPFDGGANPKGNDEDAEYLPVVPHNNDEVRNDGDLFCSDQVFLSDGRLLVAGGTSYYLEPGVSGVPYGVTELEGLKNARIFDPATNRWTQTGSMNYGRWYPSLVTLADGKVFVASGVTKLIKPIYPERPQDSGTNVTQTETFDPKAGKWTVNPATAAKSLPLYPRLHLLPDGKVYYDAAGQTFNPMGQSYDEATWNLTSVYDPKTATWRDLGVPVLGGAPLGFRGSGMSQMLPLKAPYTKVSFLNAGGVAGATPGAYVGTNTSTINTVDTAADDAFTSEATEPMAGPRWYATGVTLPTGQVLAFNGADRDEVVGPGTGTPTKTVEMFNPESKKWISLATQTKGRTYHNSAILLPDGRVLLGGHSPIGTGYASQNDAGTAAGLSSPYRDPSFEIYSPPNLFYGKRPVIRSVDPAVKRGTSIAISTTDAKDIASVVLVRNPALTHLIDGDQRVVELTFRRTATGVVADVPANPAVTPPGPYLLFVNKMTKKGLTPSVGRQVFVGAPVPAALRAQLAKAAKTSARTETATAAAPAGADTAARPAAGAADSAAESAGSVQPAAVEVAPASARSPLRQVTLPALAAAFGLALLVVARPWRRLPRRRT